MNQTNLINYWYNFKPLQFEMVKFLKDREMALLSDDLKASTRFLRADSVVWFNKTLEMLKFPETKRYNLYYSLSKYKEGVPAFGFNLAKRKEKTKDWFGTAWSEITAHDLLFDFDADDFEDVTRVKKEVATLKEYLDRYKVGYSIRYSGKGFHIVIPFENIRSVKSFNPDDRENIYIDYRTILDCVKTVFKLDSLDTKCSGYARIMKLPYSLALYEDEMKACLPLTNKQFEEFNLDLVNPKYILDNIQIFKRGEVLRKNESGGFEKFLGEVRY